MTVTDAAREVIRRCEELARSTEEPGHITRTFLSEPMRAVHGALASWMSAAGMDTRIDNAGNIRGVYDAAPGTPRLLIGSHLDTVPHAGAFDGVLGVVAGVALVHLLAPARLPFAIEVIGFSEEEGVRFGVPFIGSRALAGSADETLLSRTDAHGTTVGEAIAAFGLDPAGISSARHHGRALGYLEIHIEQGPVLDARGVPLGVVDSIAGQSRAELTFEGRAGHAGTTPMDARRDALAAAAEWLTATEHLARSTPGLVATAGQISVAPGAGNVVPGLCRVSLDVRHADDAIRAGAVAGIRASATAIAGRRGVVLQWNSRLEQPATPMDDRLVDLLGRAVATTGGTPFRMTSGAGHDAMVLAPLMPAAMLFVRSPGGVSHHPDECVRVDDVAAALTTGLAFFDLLAEQVHG